MYKIITSILSIISICFGVVAAICIGLLITGFQSGRYYDEPSNEVNLLITSALFCSVIGLVLAGIRTYIDVRKNNKALRITSLDICVSGVTLLLLLWARS